MKSILYNIISICILTLLFVGCGPGPMQLAFSGPVKTPAFEPIILDTINDNSKKVNFKEYTFSYDKKEWDTLGIFVITENGVYFAQWDTTSFIYNILYKVRFEEIDSVSNEKVVRSIFANTNLLVIKDRYGNESGFGLRGRSAAKNIIINKLNLIKSKSLN